MTFSNLAASFAVAVATSKPFFPVQALAQPEFATMALGILPITVFGGGFWPTAIAVVIGSALGACTVAILSVWGPKFGVPQMVQSRGAFGFFGNFLPAGQDSTPSG